MATDIQLSFVIKNTEKFTPENLLQFLKAFVADGFITLDNDLGVYGPGYKKEYLNSQDDVEPEIEKRIGTEDGPYFLFEFAGPDTSGPYNGLAQLAQEIIEASNTNAEEQPNLSVVSLYSASISCQTTEFDFGTSSTVASFQFGGDGAVDAASLFNELHGKPQCKKLVSLLSSCFDSQVEFTAQPVF